MILEPSQGMTNTAARCSNTSWSTLRRKRQRIPIRKRKRVPPLPRLVANISVEHESIYSLEIPYIYDCMVYAGLCQGDDVALSASGWYAPKEPVADEAAELHPAQTPEEGDLRLSLKNICIYIYMNGCIVALHQSNSCDSLFVCFVGTSISR